MYHIFNHNNKINQFGTTTWVLVHDYEYKYEYYYFGAHEYEYEYEYQKFSTRVLRVRVPSASTPALITRHDIM